MTVHACTPADPAQLLESYRPGTPFFFATPRRTLLADGVSATLPDGAPTGGHSGRRTLPQRVAALGAPVVVGAVPFDVAGPARLMAPVRLQVRGPLGAPTGEPVRQPPAPPCRVRAVPEPAEYARGVAQVLSRLAGGDLDKVVLARSLQLTSPAPFDQQRLLVNLAQGDPGGYTFAVDLRGRTLLGASPELLVSRSGRQVVSNPLAGSAARSDDPVEDVRRGAALLTSAKDRREHAIVVDAVAAVLGRYCRRLEVPALPSLRQTAAMWHLSSRITGELADPDTSALTLAMALHPTPAVCGWPTAAAQATIAEIEPFDRGFYAGMVGWCDADGDGEWVVTIRCAEVDGCSARLFAGAGIVAGSRPEDEVAETEAKFRTVLRAMGLTRAV